MYCVHFVDVSTCFISQRKTNLCPLGLRKRKIYTGFTFLFRIEGADVCDIDVGTALPKEPGPKPLRHQLSRVSIMEHRHLWNAFKNHL
jgi:hypothetical protein